VSCRTGMWIYPATPSMFWICSPSLQQAAHNASWDWGQIPQNTPESTLHNTVYHAPFKAQHSTSYYFPNHRFKVLLSIKQDRKAFAKKLGTCSIMNKNPCRATLCQQGVHFSPLSCPCPQVLNSASLWVFSGWQLVSCYFGLTERNKVSVAFWTF